MSSEAAGAPPPNQPDTPGDSGDGEVDNNDMTNVNGTEGASSDADGVVNSVETARPTEAEDTPGGTGTGAGGEVSSTTAGPSGCQSTASLWDSNERKLEIYKNTKDVMQLLKDIEEFDKGMRDGLAALNQGPAQMPTPAPVPVVNLNPPSGSPSQGPSINSSTATSATPPPYLHITAEQLRDRRRQKAAALKLAKEQSSSGVGGSSSPQIPPGGQNEVHAGPSSAMQSVVKRKWDPPGPGQNRDAGAVQVVPNGSTPFGNLPGSSTANASDPPLSSAEALAAKLRETFNLYKMQMGEKLRNQDVGSAAGASSSSNIPRNNANNANDTAEELRARLRERFNQFKMKKEGQVSSLNQGVGSMAGASSSTSSAMGNFSPHNMRVASSWAYDNHAPSPRLPPLAVEATPPKLPNWDEQCQETIMALQQHKTFPVGAATQEFRTITELMSPFKVTSAERVINPVLWTRYCVARKEMLKAKSEDQTLLAQLSLDQMELEQRATLSQKFLVQKDPLLSGKSAEYSPNDVLLFHCTRDGRNLGKILDQGLDERLSNTKGGILGKGIYFADDPAKASAYDGTKETILIFAVLLGDCLSLHNFATMKTSAREPEKLPMQKRNISDLFFDSIVARPKGYNEYVIYNRYQCCPLYLVKYKDQPGRVPVQVTKKYAFARRNMPTIAWNPMPNQSVDGGWPFYAAPLMERMHAVQVVNMADDDDVDEYPAHSNPNWGAGAGAIAPSTSTSRLVGVSNMDMVEENRKVFTIQNLLGINDEAKVRTALRRFHADLDLTVSYLLDNDNGSNQPGPSTSTGGSTSPGSSFSKMMRLAGELNSKSEEQNTRKPRFPMTPVIPLTRIPEPGQSSSSSGNGTATMEPRYRTYGGPITSGATNSQTGSASSAMKEDCTICCEEYDAYEHSPHLWRKLKCEHKLCLNCYKNIETNRSSMSGLPHISIRCPFCQEISGTLVGTSPDGKMNVLMTSDSCGGYPGRPSFQIEYSLTPPSGRGNIKRVAYLPNTPEGHEVLKLLKIAWERRLIFEMGNSHTTGAQNVPVWNIHHKTRLSGGAEAHGYPDPTYLERVRVELKMFGVY